MKFIETLLNIAALICIGMAIYKTYIDWEGSSTQWLIVGLGWAMLGAVIKSVLDSMARNKFIKEP